MAADSRVRSPFDFRPAGDLPAGRRVDAGAGTVVGLGVRDIASLAPILIVLAAAQLLDLVTFAFAVDRWGIQGELGPLGAVYEMAGYWAVAAVKVAMIGLVMLAMVRFRWQNPATPRRVGLVAAAIGALGAATNVAALM